MIRLRTSLVLAVVTAAAIARADDPLPLPADDPSCVDHDDIVGYRQCPRYGTWGQNTKSPNVFIAIGVNFRHFSDDPPAVAARTTMPTSTPDQTGGNEALTIDERIGVELHHGLYLALDFELGNFGALSDGNTANREVVFDGLAAVGYRGALGPLTLSGELAGGGMEYGYADDSALRGQAMVEVRGRADLWLGPWFTIGAALGTSIIRQDEWLAGLYLTCHSRSYAGDR